MKIKVAAVYTATTPELTAGITKQLVENINDPAVEIVSYQNAAILQEARDNGGLTPHCARMLLDLYEQGVREGATLLFNICSSVGAVARLAKPLYQLTGVEFVRIDEEMANAAVKAAKRIGVIATLPTTLEPTKKLIQECAEEQGREVVLVDALAEGAFGLNPEQFRNRLIETGKKVADKVDVLLMAQGSMAYAEQDVAKALGLPVYSSIRFGTAAVAETVRKMKAGRTA